MKVLLIVGAVALYAGFIRFIGRFTGFNKLPSG